MTYRRTQSAYVVVGVLVAAIIVVAFLMATADEVGSGLVVTWLILAFVTLVAAIFSRLTVLVGKGQVLAEFGPGWPRRRIRLETVDSIERVRNRWYHGWGIRKIRRGWLFNVWGLDAIELRFDDGRVFRIGTADPEGLSAALNAELDAVRSVDVTVSDTETGL